MFNFFGFSVLERTFVELVPAVLAKLAFTLVVGLIGLVLKVSWTTEAPYEPKKQSDDRSPAAMFTGALCQIGTYCLQTVRNAVTAPPPPTGRKGAAH